MENVGENFSTNGTDFFIVSKPIDHLQNTCKFFALLNGSLAQVIHTNFEENFRLKRGKGNTSEGTKISITKVFTQKNILAQPIGQEKNS